MVDTAHNPLQDPELRDYRAFLERRVEIYAAELNALRALCGSLAQYADLHTHLGAHKIVGQDGREYWRFREWMPAASDIWLTTDRLKFQRWAKYKFQRGPQDFSMPEGVWELLVPAEEMPHGTYMELRIATAQAPRPERRVPAFARWVEQDRNIQEQWCARLWDPAAEYVFQHDAARGPVHFPRIYEAHVGIAQAFEGRSAASVGTYRHFTQHVLPRIKAGGYTVVQLMGILEHPLYKSFGYQVSSYFAVSSRFGSVNDFKELVDSAHALGLAVVLDIPHSHACPNTEQGIARYDTSAYLFAQKENQWGTLSFAYQQDMTRRFLLSNCRYWLEEFHVDGFRMDAVGNMIYTDHGFGDDFSHVGRCFYDREGQPRLDEYGILYLSLANTLVHELAPHALTIAEEFSGMPGMTSSPYEGGLGFDYRFAMGIPDFWAKFITEGRPMGTMWYEMTNRRSYERTISYMECHDQCINGKDAMIWRLIGDDMYAHMSCSSDSWKTSRGIALFKLMRLMTLSTAGHGYLNFMGNEFGHPEWIDGETYAHRQWNLTDVDSLKYQKLWNFDKACLLGLVQDKSADFQHPPQWLLNHDEHRLLAFTRGSLLFVFNFHDTQAQHALPLWVRPGKYVEIFSSDEPDYAGHGNVVITHPPLEHFSDPRSGVEMQSISLYIPPLVVLVLRREC
ncbi:MAG: alpha-amylase family glycosyl hydrolase [Desulfovibrionaceae bacterium]